MLSPQCRVIFEQGAFLLLVSFKCHERSDRSSRGSTEAGGRRGNVLKAPESSGLEEAEQIFIIQFRN